VQAVLNNSAGSHFGGVALVGTAFNFVLGAFLLTVGA
jgi:hypothetical protein